MQQLYYAALLGTRKNSSRGKTLGHYKSNWRATLRTRRYATRREKAKSDIFHIWWRLSTFYSVFPATHLFPYESVLESTFMPANGAHAYKAAFFMLVQVKAKHFNCSTCFYLVGDILKLMRATFYIWIFSLRKVNCGFVQPTLQMIECL